MSDAEAYALLVEWKNEGPIVMESIGSSTSLARVSERASDLQSHPRVIRTAIVRLKYFQGNELMLKDMVRLHDE